MRPDWDLLEADQPYHSQGSSLRERHCPDVPLRVTTFSCSTGLPSMPPGQYSRWELWWGGGGQDCERKLSQVVRPSSPKWPSVSGCRSLGHIKRIQTNNRARCCSRFVSLSASSFWRPLLCFVTREDLFTVIFFLFLYLFTTQRVGTKRGGCLFTED